MMYQKPEKAQLQALVEEGMDGQTVDAWRQTFLNTIAQLIKADPKKYRSYGVYWWLIKPQLLADENNVSSFGDTVDSDWLEKMSYDNPALDLAAAFVYSRSRWDTGLQDSNVHWLVDEEGDSEKVCVEDPDMEAKLQVKSVV
ncbi:hypothetical protein [Endozoicomonas lisbonensis]|uniref:Uncharacterized protein n=1 Tax=Endozoicomonas lisbonensis TaxID=3120522 RepID=A0ABV2SP64_9GAMM